MTVMIVMMIWKHQTETMITSDNSPAEPSCCDPEYCSIHQIVSDLFVILQIMIILWCWCRNSELLIIVGFTNVYETVFFKFLVLEQKT